jgi:hypothetical protein
MTLPVKVGTSERKEVENNLEMHWSQVMKSNQKNEKCFVRILLLRWIHSKSDELYDAS